MSYLVGSERYPLALTDQFSDLPTSSVAEDSTREFRYQPLPDNKSFIRLLYLRPRNRTTSTEGRTILECEVIIHPVNDCPPYVALSYAWGDATIQKSVKLGSHVVSLTESLVVALEHLQHHEKTLIVWADAVCINQSDNVEKGYQVQMMSRIYKTAALVVAWLGPESEDSDKAIKQLRAFKALAFSAMAQIDEIQNMFESGQLGQTEGDEPPRAQNIEFLPVKNLLERPWFDRIWVLQEAVLNDHTLFLAGQSFLEPDALFWGGNEWVSAHYGLAHVIDHTRWQRLTPINVPLELEVFFLSSISLSVFGPGLRCSDPKDYVYGLLGLIEDAERYGLRADYSLSLVDIYTNFATALVRSKNLSFLLRLWCPETDLALPSWVPDLRVAQFNTMDTWIDGEIYQADLATSNDKRFSDVQTSASDNVFIIDDTRGQWVLRGLAQNGCYRIVSPATVYPIHVNGQWKSRREEIYLY